VGHAGGGGGGHGGAWGAAALPTSNSWSDMWLTPGSVILHKSALPAAAAPGRACQMLPVTSSYALLTLVS
jgi:hypothetical protein